MDNEQMNESSRETSNSSADSGHQSSLPSDLSAPGSIAGEIFNGSARRPRRGWLIGLVVIILIIAAGFWLAQDSGSVDEPAEGVSGPSVSTGTDKNNNSLVTAGSVPVVDSDRIVVANQMPGDTVSVSSVVLDQPGWVVVRETRDGGWGNILGALWLPAGTHTDATVELLRRTEANANYYVVLYDDNGDKQFDYQVDQPLSLSDQIIQSTFTTESEV